MCNSKLLLKSICLILVVVQVVDGFAYQHEIVRVRREAKNGNNKRCPNRTDFVCKNGQCITEDKQCDGIVDCEDESDESNACHRIKCPSYLFRCNYGACINADKECDGKPDCRDGSDETSLNCVNITASESCQENQFRCSSGQCIDGDLKCDGKADCKDNSDEITATCWNIRCPRFTYRCKYGACVDGDAECNGVVECFDGSDENGCPQTPQSCKLPQHPLHGSWVVFGFSPGQFAPQTDVDGGTILTVTCDRGYKLQGATSVQCTNGTWSSKIGTCLESVVTPPIQSGSCILPDHPTDGRWSVYKSFGTHQPGAAVGDSTILEVKCHDGYTLQGFGTTTCVNGNWTVSIGECKRGCKPIYSTEELSVTCTYGNLKTINCSNPVDGALAQFKCKPFYDLSLARNAYRVCKDGSWDLPTPTCIPACGIKSTSAQVLVVNGTSAKSTDYPWHVGLYKANGKKYICGGSLISLRTVISAAHCVADPSTGKPYPKENYIVAAGKYYRPLDDNRDKNYVQESAIKELFVQEGYQGPIQNYFADIAVLITEKTFHLSLKVQPVCLDSGFNIDIQPGTYGFVPGWGFTTAGDNLAEELKEIKVPVIETPRCETDLPEDYQKYLTFDKLCAGYLDQSKGVCVGDSGGGLVTKHRDGRYYLTGVVSLSPLFNKTVKGCDPNQYGLYTKVFNYINDILIKDRTYSVY